MLGIAAEFDGVAVVINRHLPAAGVRTIERAGAEDDLHCHQGRTPAD